MNKLKAHTRQSVADIALQSCGDIRAAYRLAADNGLSVTSTLADGQTLAFDPSAYDPRTAARLAAEGIRPSNAAFPDERLGTTFDDTFDTTFV